MIAFLVEGEATSVLGQNETFSENRGQQACHLPIAQEAAGLRTKLSDVGPVLEACGHFRKRRRAIAFLGLFLQAFQDGWND